jgi:hypothetical protein
MNVCCFHFVFDVAAIACFCLLFSKLCFVPACLHKFTLLTGDFITRPHAENGEIYPCECMNCYILLPAYAASNKSQNMFAEKLLIY